MPNSKNELIKLLQEASRAYSDTTILMHGVIAKRAGLSGADHKYLDLIIDKGRMTAGELADATGLTTGAITGVVDRLEARDLVKRQIDPDDRRKVYIIPNASRANALLGPLFTPLAERTASLYRSFTMAELRVINNYLRKAVEIMEQTITDLK